MSSSPSPQPSSQSPSLPPVVEPAHATTPPSTPAQGRLVQSTQAPSAKKTNQDRDAVLTNRGLILGLLFGVLAILGLPLLWYSPAFSRTEKLWWSVAITVYTAVLVAIAGAALMMAYNAWTQSRMTF